ncbi:glycosyltransferase family 4 protein [Steroidobacter sp. S1-65]|uniref:Glycosyltransferase family 4 protein n=1 Tax=Steroidobacter gossypii TaxID=2805490 RepID=A0ABS1X478_9GAMM|nr:glycosyltransferase family 4 protein [Steroidobacter gossypii]MBM0108041.1 glycosyltransferase family 4 protein [Steroidobacter gossypii]
MTADSVGGVWTYALDLCAALHEFHVCFVLVTMGPRPSNEQRAAARTLPNVELVESDFRLEWMEDPWSDVTAAGDFLLELASAKAVDLVHLNGYTHAALAWRHPVVCVAHSCVATWWQAAHGVPAPAQWDVYRSHVARGLNSADAVVAPTFAFVKQLRECYEFDRPVRVIHNARVQAAESSAAMKKIQGDAIVLACGRPWDASKNMRVLDDASAGASWPAYVVGAVVGPDGQSFAPTSLVCLGALSSKEVESWLRKAAIFVHPALYEPFGLAVLEAALAGCALVLADIPTLRELWNGAAEFFDPHDSRQLRAVIDELIAQPTRCASLGAAARERATRYRIEATGAAYMDLYGALLRSNASAPASDDKRAVA